jgi:hypothetical protein
MNAVEEQKPGDVMALDRRVDNDFASSTNPLRFEPEPGGS